MVEDRNHRDGAAGVEAPRVAEDAFPARHLAFHACLEFPVKSRDKPLTLIYVAPLERTWTFAEELLNAINLKC